MSFKQFMLLRIIAIIVVATLAVWTAATDNWWIMIPIVIIGTTILLLFSRRVKEIIVDERVHSIADKASRLAVKIFVGLTVVTGAVLIILGRDGSPQLFQAGLTLAYSVCAILVIYWIAYFYYSRKYSGKK